MRFFTSSLFSDGLLLFRRASRMANVMKFGEIDYLMSPNNRVFIWF
jgi:hypothetical protein